MLLLLTIGLVLVGAVSLVWGFVSQDTLPIYISIACSVAAGLVLLVFSRMNRRQPVVAAGTPAAADAGGPATTEYVLQEASAAARAHGRRRLPDADYDQLLSSRSSATAELEVEELDQVRPVRRASRRGPHLRRIAGWRPSSRAARRTDTATTRRKKSKSKLAATTTAVPDRRVRRLRVTRSCAAAGAGRRRSGDRPSASARARRAAASSPLASCSV